MVGIFELTNAWIVSCFVPSRSWIAWIGMALLSGVRSGAAESEIHAESSAPSGKEVFQACQLCHSTKEMQRGPILDGLPEWYVTSQLRKFKTGLRGGLTENRSAALMVPVMSTLESDLEVQRVAEYIADLPPQPHLLVIRGDKKIGKAIYTRCIPCHGLGGEGNPAAKAPPINLMEDWYLLDQLRKFQRGWRGYDDRDVEAKLMALGVKPMTTQELRNVVRYIAEDLAEVPPLKPVQPPTRTLAQ